MKKCFLPLTAAVACFILAACASVEYQGESLPALSSDTPVKFYLVSELDKMPGVVVLGTAEYTARPSLTSKDIRETLRTAARREGANGIRIVFMEKIPDGEARKDQINNTVYQLPVMGMRNDQAAIVNVFPDQLLICAYNVIRCCIGSHLIVSPQAVRR